MAKMIKKEFIPHDIENDYNIYYSDKDGRYRAYNKKTGKGVSYPRLLMENYLGRKLDKNEDVHHIDEDKSNNDISNLEVIDHVKHEKMHNPRKIWYDEFRKCPICGKTFQWTDTKQKSFYGNRNRIKKRYKHMSDVPFCSKRCAGIYGKRIQEQIKKEKERNKYL